MATTVVIDPLVQQLIEAEAKGEIVNDQIVNLMSTGGKPSYAAGRIFLALSFYEGSAGGIAFGDNAGFLCDLPNRKSFSPDAAFYVGPEPEMGFLPQPPVFAVEVRNGNDYGPQADGAKARRLLRGGDARRVGR